MFTQARYDSSIYIGAEVWTAVAPGAAPPTPPASDGYLLTKDSTVVTGAKWVAPATQFFQMSGFSGNTTIAAGVTNYGPLSGNAVMAGTPIDAGVQSLVGISATISHLYVHEGASHVTGDNVHTVFLNGVATTMTVTLTGATRDGSDLTHSITIAPGDQLSMQIVTDAASTAVRHSWAVTCTTS